MTRYFVGMSVSEKSLLQKLRAQVLNDTSLSFDFQDDCARIPAGQDLLVTTDSLIEGVHFRRHSIKAKDLGWKTLAVNLSDLASKGAAPVGFFLNWSLPKDLGEDWIDDFLEGLNDAAIFGSCPLLGGDTTGSPGPLIFQITAVGRTANAKVRGRARSGDLLFTTGTLGLSSLGLSIQEGEWSQRELTTQMKHQALKRHHRPSPRLREGAWLAAHPGVHAMMDLSDGIARDVPRMAAAAKLGFNVWLDQLPQCAELQALRQAQTLTSEEAMSFAFWGGEDYELLVSVDRLEASRISRDFAEALGVPLYPIGELLEDEAIETSAKDSDQTLAAQLRSVPSGAFPTLRFEHF